MDKNARLREVHDKWKEQIFNPFLIGKEGEISIPFCLGLSKAYLSDDSVGKRLMIVGQEPKDFKPEKEAQEDSLEFLESMLGAKNDGNKRFYNSPFWRFLRFFAGNGWVPCWNNVDKAHRYEGKETAGLPYEYELALNTRYCVDGESSEQSILQREIDIAKPDAIIFACGPDYWQSLGCAFGLKQDTLIESSPTEDNPITRICLPNISVPVFWTYHPNYLNYLGGDRRDELWNKLLEGISSST